MAIVTGGTRGIGRAITFALLESGYDVYFTYSSNKELADEIESKYPESARGFLVNSASLDEIKVFSDMVLETKVPDVLINNVGINQDAMFINQSMEKIQEIMALNFGSTIFYSKCFVNCMLQKRRGHIVNISSVSAIKPKVGNGAYGSSKAAIERFSKTLALEVARFNVRVNCVSPAYVETDLFNEFLNSQNREEFYKNIPMRKVLETNDVSNLVLALCNDVIKTTGSVFYIGNGENIVN